MGGWGGVFSSPAVVDGVVYVGQGRDVYALDAASGQLRWRYETGSGVYSSPAVVDGVVYVGSYDDYLYALDAASGQLRWRYETGNRVYSSPAVVDGVVYVGSRDNYLYAVVPPTLASAPQAGGLAQRLLRRALLRRPRRQGLAQRRPRRQRPRPRPLLRTRLLPRPRGGVTIMAIPVRRLRLWTSAPPSTGT